jgi:hypothetical protein
MKITVNEFAQSSLPLPVIVHSIDMVGYQATVIIEQKECLLVGPNGRPLRYSSLMQMREKLSTLPTSSVVLSHQSAYDEMINQPIKQGKNTLTVPLSNDLYPDPARTTLSS